MPRSLQQLLAQDAAIPNGAGDVLISGITSDSRAVKPGFIFAALPGTKNDLR
jgi:UDP-N-acetylmuramoyl-L-alanyl-D-glutamate--2,6-diaminopimelate ligase